MDAVNESVLLSSTEENDENKLVENNNNNIKEKKAPQDQLNNDDSKDDDGEQHFRPSFMEAGITNHVECQIISLDVVKNLVDEFNQLEEEVEKEVVENETEKIKVYLRIRPPPTKNEQKQPTIGTGTVADNRQYIIDDSHSIRIISETSQPLSRRFKGQLFNEKQFKFSHIFNSESSQSTVFEETTTPLVNDFLRGEKCLLFSYGATNSGKTFTMQGYGTNFGIIPRTLEAIFNQIEEKLYLVGDLKPTNTDGVLELSLAERDSMESRKLQLIQSLRKNKKKLASFSGTKKYSLESVRDNPRSNSTSTMASICEIDIQNINSVPVTEVPNYVSYPKSTKLYSVWISFAEIYNERVYDLFSNEKEKKSGKLKEIKVVSDGKGGFYMRDLTEFCVNSAEEAFKLFLVGKQNLKFASTKANINSSRSHSFFNIRIVKIVTTGTRGVIVEPKNLKMSFCDLAGIEKAILTENVGNRLVESNKINNSLSKLLHCIRELRLVQKDGKKRTIPYRDSKLCQLFSDFLTENSHISMIVNINPDPKHIESSFHILQNSAIASGIVSYRNNYVEPPQNNSNFFKKFRESIGLKREELPNIDEDDDDNDEEEEEVNDVQQLEDNHQEQQINSALNFETNDEKLTRLEVENARLRNELATIEQNVKESLIRQYDEIIADIHKEYETNAKIVRRQERYLSERRLSLSLKIMGMEYQDRIKKVGGTNGTGDLTLIDENDEENEINEESDNSEDVGGESDNSEAEVVGDDENEWEDVNNGEEYNCDGENLATVNQKSRLTPICSPIQSQEDVYVTPENETSRTITDYFSQNQDLLGKNSELEDIVRGLQKSLDDQRKKVHDLQEMNKENSKLFEERCKHYEELIEIKNREIAKLHEENPLKMKEELRNEIQSINSSLKSKNEEIESLRRDVEDGRITCVEYHRSLETANSNIKRLTEKINSINSELESVKHEKHITDIKNAELSQDISEYKVKLGVHVFLSSDGDDTNDVQLAPKNRRGAKGRGQLMRNGSTRLANYSRQSIGKKKNSKKNSTISKMMKKNGKGERAKDENSFNISTLTEEEHDTDGDGDVPRPSKSSAAKINDKKPKEQVQLTQKLQSIKKRSNNKRKHRFFSSVSTSSSEDSDDVFDGTKTPVRVRSRPREKSTATDPGSALRRSSRVKSTQSSKSQK